MSSRRSLHLSESDFIILYSILSGPEAAVSLHLSRAVRNSV